MLVGCATAPPPAAPATLTNATVPSPPAQHTPRAVEPARAKGTIVEVVPMDAPVAPGPTPSENPAARF